MRLPRGWAGSRLETPEQMVAEARKAFFVMFGFTTLLWVVQIANWAGHYWLALSYGIVPHDFLRLPEILAAPFLHFSWAHIEDNSGPLFVFGFLAVYRGVVRFLWLTLLIAVTSGLAVWVLQSGDSLTVGASGLIFGYFAYVVVRGLFDRHLIDTLIGLVMAASFAYTMTLVLPGVPRISWIGHLGGLVGGLAGAWLLRDRRPGSCEPAASGVGPDHPRSDLHKELGDLGLL
jgi:membrane associated rhomboid family serine protease